MSDCSLTLSLKLVVSTTSVVPSQCPRESPSQLRMGGPTWGRPSTRDEAHVVDHLDEQQHVTGGLMDLVVVIVEARHHRARQAAGDASFEGASVFGRISRPRPARRSGLRACGRSATRVLCVFQGAVDAGCASTAPAASTDRRQMKSERKDRARPPCRECHRAPALRAPAADLRPGEVDRERHPVGSCASSTSTRVMRVTGWPGRSSKGA